MRLLLGKGDRRTHEGKMRRCSEPQAFPLICLTTKLGMVAAIFLLASIAAASSRRLRVASIACGVCRERRNRRNDARDAIGNMTISPEWRTTMSTTGKD